MASCLSFLGGASIGIAGALLWQKKKKRGGKAEDRLDEFAGEDIFPDLVTAHTKVGTVSGRTSGPSDLHYLRLLPLDQERKWMFYLMPVWNWHDVAPEAAEFWKLAHAVSRDQKNDDWIAPHVTLHSRVTNLQGLIEKFGKLLAELGRDSWKDVLSTLQKGDNWIFDDDTETARPTNANHHVLHKARINCPDPLRAWLAENEGDMLHKPRKKELHISLYGFRVKAVDLDEGAPPLKQYSSYAKTDPRVAHHGLAVQNDIRYDLSHANWTLVLMSPGRTDSHALTPRVLAAVKLSDLASEAWKQ